MNEVRTDIRKFSKKELEDYFISLGEPKFRAGQVYSWLWQKGATSFDEMTNLSLALRTKFAVDEEADAEIKLVNFDLQKSY